MPELDWEEELELLVGGGGWVARWPSLALTPPEVAVAGLDAGPVGGVRGEIEVELGFEHSGLAGRVC